MNSFVSPNVCNHGRRGGRQVAAHGLILALLLSSCAVGPDYKPPQVTPPPAWVSTPDKKDRSLVVPSPVTTVEWWTMLNDEQLNELIKKAATQNLTVLQANQRIVAARASLGITDAGLFPTVNGTGGYSYGAAGGATPNSNFNVGGSAGWNIDVFGGIRRQIEAAEANVDAAIQDRRDAIVALAAQIGITYVDLRTVQKRLDITHINLGIQDHSVDVTRQRWEGGFVSRLDYENALAQQASTRAQLPSLETQERQDIYALSVLLGLDPGALLDELEPTAPIPKVPSTIPVGVPSDLLRRRPDIRAAEAQFHAATAGIGVAIADLFPKFSLTSNLQFNSGTVAQLVTWTNSSWNVGPSVSWQIFAAGRIVANIHLQEANQVQAFYFYKNTVLTAFQQVEDSIIAYAKEQERHQYLKDAVAANERALTLANTSYREGSTIFLNVLQAQAALYSAQQQEAVSDQSLASDLITLYQALGGGWSAFPEQDSVPVEFPRFPYASPPKEHASPHGQ
jgi:NodT family efflux transporter outer membrane factor (OMF) lipoprotein